MVIEIKNILDRGELSRLDILLKEAPYVDGRVSAPAFGNKNNLEMSCDSEQYIEILKIVELGVRRNDEFKLTAFPRYMTRPIISRFDAGMSYASHVDRPVMGFFSLERDFSPVGSNYVRTDFSLTLFLSDINSYDGGELQFEEPDGTHFSKLEAGCAVLYATGVRHSVVPVTRGTRYAAVFWVQTMLPIDSQRRAVMDAHLIMSRMSPESEDFFFAQAHYYDLVRIFAHI